MSRTIPPIFVIHSSTRISSFLFKLIIVSSIHIYIYIYIQWSHSGFPWCKILEEIWAEDRQLINKLNQNLANVYHYLPPLLLQAAKYFPSRLNPFVLSHWSEIFFPHISPLLSLFSSLYNVENQWKLRWLSPP